MVTLEVTVTQGHKLLWRVCDLMHIEKRSGNYSIWIILTVTCYHLMCVGLECVQYKTAYTNLDTKQLMEMEIFFKCCTECT